MGEAEGDGDGVELGFFDVFLVVVS